MFSPPLPNTERVGMQRGFDQVGSQIPYLGTTDKIKSSLTNAWK